MKPQLKPFLAGLEGQDIHVVGLGSTECTAFLQVLPNRVKERVTIHDFSPTDEDLKKSFMTTHVALNRTQRESLWNQLIADYPQRRLRTEYLKGVDTADLLFVPQSWDLYAPNKALGPWIEEHPGKVLTLMDLYLRHLPCRVVGVSGTNGKTTVSSMIATLADHVGLKVVVSGNHRYHAQLLPDMDTVDPNAVAVLEISHKHLARIQQGPDISVLTNVSGDHLDQFDSFDAYAARKRRLVETQPSGSVAIVNGEDPQCRLAVQGHEGTLYAMGKGLPEARYTGEISTKYLFTREAQDSTFKGLRESLSVPGVHNAANMWMAMAALHALGIPWEQSFQGASAFRGVKHRLEYLRALEGVAIYDDTAATSPSATLAAIEAIESKHGQMVLVVGGEGKGNDYESLSRYLKTSNITVLGLGGDVAKTLAAQPCVSLREAIQMGLKECSSGAAILISPAGAGFHTAHSEGSEPGLRQMVRRWGR